MMFKYCLCCNTVCAPLVKCVILSINISALCYFNGSFNSFENILHSKTCQSYSWMTLSNIISLVILMGCHAIFFSRHFVPNCTVTLLSDGVTIVHWNNWSGSQWHINDTFHGSQLFVHTCHFENVSHLI